MPNHYECARNLHSPPYCNCDLCIDGNHKENHIPRISLSLKPQGKNMIQKGTWGGIAHQHTASAESLHVPMHVKKNGSYQIR